MSSPNLAQRLLEVNKKLGWISKNGTAAKEQGGYAYVRIVDILDDVRGALNDHGVIFTHSTTGSRVTVIPREGKGPNYLSEAWGTYAYINADDPKDVNAGEWQGSALDTGDKGLWKAITGGLKYVLIPNHLLPTGDDPEAADEEPGERPAATKSSPAAGLGLSNAQKEQLTKALTEQGLTVTKSQRFVLGHLTGKNRSADMTEGDLNTVLEFFKGDADKVQELVVRAMAEASKG